MEDDLPNMETDPSAKTSDPFTGALGTYLMPTMIDLDRKYLELKERYLTPKRAEISGLPDPDKRRKQKYVKKKTTGPPDHPPTVPDLDKCRQHKDIKRNIT
ncbi:hypothetical protein TNCV_1650561 [Trichonephila clavipes]|nr:hypothetical protein TNCV_1650561 [Trichonephila clavipes]